MKQPPAASRRDPKSRGGQQQLFFNFFFGFSLRPLRFFAPLREMLFGFRRSAFSP